MKVLRFTASWCGPCKMLAKVLEDVETDKEIQVLDIDEEQELAKLFNIRSVPTLVMIDEEKKEVKRLNGLQSQQQVEEWING